MKYFILPFFILCLLLGLDAQAVNPEVKDGDQRNPDPPVASTPRFRIRTDEESYSDSAIVKKRENPPGLNSNSQVVNPEEKDDGQLTPATPVASTRRFRMRPY